MENGEFLDLNGRRLRKIGERYGDEMSEIHKPKEQRKHLHNLKKETKAVVLKRFRKTLIEKATHSEMYFRNMLNSMGIDHCFQYGIIEKDQFIIADFYIKSLNIIVEIDGGYHSTDKQIMRDNLKDAYYEKNGYSILRIRNEDVTQFDYDGLLFCYRKGILTENIKRWLKFVSMKNVVPKKKKKKKKGLPYSKKYKQNEKDRGDKIKCRKCKREAIRQEVKGDNRRPNQRYAYKYIYKCVNCGTTYLDKSSRFFLR